MMKTSQAGRITSARGFTLVELLVVLAIIALISALAVPTISRGFGTGLRAEAEELGTVLRQARVAAIRDNRETAVIIDPAERSVRGAAGTVAMRLDDDLAVSLVIAQHDLSGTAGAIRFLPDGRSSGARITLARSGRSEEVTVDWFDGSVSHDPAPRN